ncbi:chorismate synthase [Terribacillus saccharophilus]|jgi:hypothetical protein|uniref:Uncharacterized protein n=1 Tax=Terribacillus saccharophilus TaxID=361277 RepID=A0ABX4H3X3_9BACI|nr:chorismate synthase [Terribacillus saccharophilus]PAD34193.1 hypothetical protein CHH56_16085 [Terribacillus saccharophilus]PAD98077.1 hypothetical protein CHH50_00445 [Terribacillus saccharophilus]PAE01719.1 hypothetical protein CHH48_00445 [Terribacillus saccharophilus]
MSFLWFKTDTEAKRDEYLKLYHKLEDAKTEHDKLVSEAESYFSSYKGSTPCMTEDAIPSSDFIPAQERLNKKLTDYLDDEKEHRSKLVTASDRAYERYLHYKRKAMDEAKED